MKTKYGLVGFAFLSVLLFSVWVSADVTGEVRKGRTALLSVDASLALSHFQRAAESNPDYFFDMSPYDHGVLTYMGQAYYAMGKYVEAKKALERARSRYAQDHLAKLYLGLTLARLGKRREALSDIEAGVKGLREWLDNFEATHIDSQFWDSKRLGREIQRILEQIKGKDIIWEELVTSGEWLGTEFDEAIDEADQDREDELKMDQ